MIRIGTLWEMTGCVRVITLIGAGGKTTSLQRLGREIQAAGYEAVLTTTTKVWPLADIVAWKNPTEPPPNTPYDLGKHAHLLSDDDYASSTNSSNVYDLINPAIWFWYAREEQESGKWVGPKLESVDKAVNNTGAVPIYLYGNGTRLNHVSGRDLGRKAYLPGSRLWVIEGDGAKERGLKCWAEHEPQIPSTTECAILVIDGTLWGRKLSGTEIHRPECCQALNGRVWDKGVLWEYLFGSPAFSANYTKMQWVVFFNDKGVGEMTDIEELLPNDDVRDLYSLREKPLHLRLAAGNGRAGEIRSVDVW